LCYHNELQINSLFETDLLKIQKLGRSKLSCIKVLGHLKKIPQTSVPLLSMELNITAPTARSALNSMLELSILQEVSGKKRGRVFMYTSKYLDILNEEAEPFSY
jgi:Fic family protein